MANIVELREMSDVKLEEMLENGREEMFNLRFQQASSRLEDYTRLKVVRREIAQLETVLNMRQLAIETAVANPSLSAALAGKEWDASVRYVYEDSGWHVEFVDEDGEELATALVNLNKKRPHSRRQAKKKSQPQRVVMAEIAE